MVKQQEVRNRGTWVLLQWLHVIWVSRLDTLYVPFCCVLDNIQKSNRAESIGGKVCAARCLHSRCERC